MMTSAVLVALLLSSSLAAAECATRWEPSSLESALESAEASWSGADEQAFFQSMEQATVMLPCLSSVIEPRLAARYHRDAGLWLFAMGDTDRALLAFAAARRSAPDEVLPSELVSLDHPARALHDQAWPGSEQAGVPQPAGGSVFFDGTEGPRPTEVNTIFQLQLDGQAPSTRLLMPEAPLPSYDVEPWKLPKGPTFAVAAGLSALTAGGLAVGAYASKERFIEAPPQNQRDLDERYRRNHLLSASSAAMAGTAGALTFAAVWAW